MRLGVHLLDPVVELASVDQLAVDAYAASRRRCASGPTARVKGPPGERHASGNEQRRGRPQHDRQHMAKNETVERIGGFLCVLGENYISD